MIIYVSVPYFQPDHTPELFDLFIAILSEAKLKANKALKVGLPGNICNTIQAFPPKPAGRFVEPAVAKNI